MKILILLSVLTSFIIFSGCTGETQVQEVEAAATGTTTPSETPAPAGTLAAVPIGTPAPSPVSTTVKPLTKYDKFVEWLKTDATDKHPYILDPSKVYEDQYVCAQYTRDFLKNATGAGFEAYAVLLTGGIKGQNGWHMITAVILDNNLYFIEPQKDIIFKKEDLLNAYGFECAYFGKEVYISRNDAVLNQKISYHSVIGLDGNNYLYLK